MPQKYAVVGEQAARVLPDLEAFKRIVESYDMELLGMPDH